MDDDAVRAQLEQQPVAVGLLLERLLGCAVGGDVGDDADAAGDRRRRRPMTGRARTSRVALVALAVADRCARARSRSHGPPPSTTVTTGSSEPRGEVGARARRRAAVNVSRVGAEDEWSASRASGPGRPPRLCSHVAMPRGREREVMARREPVGLARRELTRRVDPGRPAIRSSAQVFSREPSHAPPAGVCRPPRGISTGDGPGLSRFGPPARARSAARRLSGPVTQPLARIERRVVAAHADRGLEREALPAQGGAVDAGGGGPGRPGAAPG